MLKYFAGFGFCKILKYVWPNTFPFNSLNMPCRFPQKFEPYVSDSFTLNSSTCLGRMMCSTKASWTRFVGAFILIGKQLEPEPKNPGSSFNAQIPARIRELWTGWGTLCFWRWLAPNLAAGRNYFDSSLSSCRFHFRGCKKSLMV